MVQRVDPSMATGGDEDPLVAEAPPWVCSLTVPPALDEDTGERVEALVRARRGGGGLLTLRDVCLLLGGLGVVGGALCWAQAAERGESLLLCANAPPVCLGTLLKPIILPFLNTLCQLRQVVQGDGRTAADAKAAAAAEAVRVLARGALWAKRMVELEPAPSLWATVALALSDEVRSLNNPRSSPCLRRSSNFSPSHCCRHPLNPSHTSTTINHNAQPQHNHRQGLHKDLELRSFVLLAQQHASAAAGDAGGAGAGALSAPLPLTLLTHSKLVNRWFWRFGPPAARGDHGAMLAELHRRRHVEPEGGSDALHAAGALACLLLPCLLSFPLLC